MRVEWIACRLFVKMQGLIRVIREENESYGIQGDVRQGLVMCL